MKRARNDPQAKRQRRQRALERFSILSRKDYLERDDTRSYEPYTARKEAELESLQRSLRSGH